MLAGTVATVVGRMRRFTDDLAHGLRDCGATIAASIDERPLHAVVHVVGDAAAYEATPLIELDPRDWDRRCEALLRESIATARAARRAFEREGGGVLVYVVPSITVSGAPFLVPLITATEGVRSLAKAAARQWGAHGVRAHCVAVPVELLADGHDVTTPSSLGEPALGRRPDARHDVAPAIATLVSRATRAVTGATVVVDGGVVMVP